MLEKGRVCCLKSIERYYCTFPCVKFSLLLSLLRIGYVAPGFVGSVFDLDNGHGGSSNFAS